MQLYTSWDFRRRRGTTTSAQHILHYSELFVTLILSMLSATYPNKHEPFVLHVYDVGLLFARKDDPIHIK